MKYNTHQFTVLVYDETNYASSFTFNLRLTTRYVLRTYNENRNLSEGPPVLCFNDFLCFFISTLFSSHFMPTYIQSVHDIEVLQKQAMMQLCFHLIFMLSAYISLADVCADINNLFGRLFSFIYFYILSHI